MPFHPDSEYSPLQNRFWLLTPGEAAAVLHVSVTTLRNWVRTGRLQAYRTPNGQFRYPREAVRALAEGRARDARPRPSD